MSILSKQFDGHVSNSSMIRAMFEAGIRLKKEHGEDAVCDFSLGNPDLPAPAAVSEGLKELLAKGHQPFAFGYMPNGGFPWAREALAKQISSEQGISLDAGDVMLSSGAAGAVNCLFRAILDPQDEVIGITPYFVDYGFYVSNHGGVIKPVPASLPDFGLDLDAIEEAITPRTRAIIINSPNNPTGQVYSREELEKLVALLRRKNEGAARPIFIVADEPYRFLAFDGIKVPSLLAMYEYTVVVSSLAKNMSLPGERIGYAAVSPLMPDRQKAVDGLVMANRILGFVNAPVAGQYMLRAAMGQTVDLATYARRREAMAKVLTEAGYEFQMPKGAFYFFPKAPGGDDLAFTTQLAKELVLGVPGRGFGLPGYFRLAFCVDEKVILRSASGFRQAREAITG